MAAISTSKEKLLNVDKTFFILFLLKQIDFHLFTFPTFFQKAISFFQKMTISGHVDEIYNGKEVWDQLSAHNVCVDWGGG